MAENIDNILESLLPKVIAKYGNGGYIRLKDIDGIEIMRFSNVTVGKEKVDYQLINTNDITEEGRIVLHDPENSLRQLGSSKGVKKYQIKKGDIIFPQKRSFRTIGVMIKDTKIAHVGYHGLMKISCGADKMDLAFFLKDYLLWGPIGDFIAKYVDDGKKLIDLIGLMPIPKWAIADIVGYGNTSLNIKDAEQKLSLLQEKIKLLSEKNNAYIDNRDDITKDTSRILKTLETMEKQVDSLLQSK